MSFEEIALWAMTHHYPQLALGLANDRYLMINAGYDTWWDFLSHMTAEKKALLERRIALWEAYEREVAV